jgi:hypothetical protein
MFIHLRRAALALALVSSVFVAACDDDDDNGPSPIQTPTPSPTPAATPEPSPSPSASPTPSAGQEVVFLGRVQSIGATAWQVGGRDVQVNEDTRYRRGGQDVPASSFAVGDVVRVHGVELDGGGVLADRISLEE